MADDRTTIWISDDLWEALNAKKKRGDSFEDVIWRLVEESDNQE